MSTRFSPEPGWYLLVEQNESSATLARHRIEKLAITGHLTGDRVNAWGAQTVRQALRESDVLARGGIPGSDDASGKAP